MKHHEISHNLKHFSQSTEKLSLYFNASHTGDENTLASSERALWRAVILQAVVDASCRSHKIEARHLKTQATDWLLGNSPGFHLVCDLAGWHPSTIRKKAKKASLNGCKWRAEAGHGERRLKEQRKRALLKSNKDTAQPVTLEAAL